MDNEENRRFRRLRASIPCSVIWGEEVFSAQVSNLSHGGALITGADRIPEEGTQLDVLLQVGQEEIRFQTRVRQMTDNDQPASFGIEFSDTPQEIESRLIRLMDILYPSDEDEEES